MMNTPRRRDLRQELRDDDGSFPTSWIPKLGDTLVGTLVRYDRGRTEYGPAHIAVVRDEEGGELHGVWLIHHVLREEFKEQRPRPGERLGIKRLPDAERGYKRYRLVVDRADLGDDIPNFDEFGDANDAAQGDWELAGKEKPASQAGQDDEIPF